MNEYRLLNYNENRSWSDVLMPLVKKLIGPYMLDTASFEDDTQRATDLTVKKVDVAVRLRDYNKYAERYLYDFTLRYSVPSGAVTEYQKISDGNADWFFYGFVEKMVIKIILILLDGGF